VMWSVL